MCKRDDRFDNQEQNQVVKPICTVVCKRNVSENLQPVSNPILTFCTVADISKLLRMNLSKRIILLPATLFEVNTSSEFELQYTSAALSL